MKKLSDIELHRLIDDLVIFAVTLGSIQPLDSHIWHYKVSLESTIGLVPEIQWVETYDSLKYLYN